ncbi:acyl-CoA dehydrogenase [Streptomyces sp. NPDC002896]|uniref:acyl-CoA dehydrogenase n=1 Tax=Streptomyces sp. NPDC002896 TaxID=3154438 RepID=UPI003333F094
MSVAISAEHRDLAATVRSFLQSRKARAAARALLDAPSAPLPDFWPRACKLGWAGLHLPEEYGGSGFGLSETAVVLEQFGHELAPGPLLPTTAASAVIHDLADPLLKERLLPGLADGSVIGAVGLGGSLALSPGADSTHTLSGETGPVLGADAATVLVLSAGEDLVVIDARQAGVTVTAHPCLDPTRRSAAVRLDGVPVATHDIIPGGRRHSLAVLRALVSAEASGLARECTQAAAAYAKDRIQFGRPIATFQAVKHHCANMLTAAELATAAAWDAARACADPADQFQLAAAAAAQLAVSAAVANAETSIQVHGGIGFTWEHDAHLFQRRALTLAALVSPSEAAADVARTAAAGTVRDLAVALPPEAEAARPAIRSEVAAIAALPETERRRAMVDSGLLMPHWPKPFGRQAPAAQQLVIEEEFAAAGIERPHLGITSWILLTLIQHVDPAQVDRLVRPALYGELIWCQLFSEPGAGSDAAGITTRGRRTAGGWLVTGQKVWTSGAREAGKGLATVRTDPDAPKHRGITTMVIDMRAPGVDVRPLRQNTGNSDFSEVFLTDVFVSDEDVIGEVDSGWTVARATMGNERVSLGGGDNAVPGSRAVDLFGLVREHGDRVPGADGRLGALLAEEHALNLLNLRSAERALAGSGPGPEGNITKLVLAEHVQRQAALVTELVGPDAVFTTGRTGVAGLMRLGVRAMTIAGGTSEITRNQIAERILGLPRDPLIG